MWGHYMFKIMGGFLGPLSEASSLTTNILFFGGICFLSMEDCAPSIFLGSWALVVRYLCSKFQIFDTPILEKICFSG
jgi:hypothetical protein